MKYLEELLRELFEEVLKGSWSFSWKNPWKNVRSNPCYRAFSSKRTNRIDVTFFQFNEICLMYELLSGFSEEFLGQYIQNSIKFLRGTRSIISDGTLRRITRETLAKNAGEASE